MCGEPMPSLDLMEHLRLFHPTEYGDGPATWSDGEPVIVDMTLSPERFDE